jgi:hypothetical protein
VAKSARAGVVAGAVAADAASATRRASR